MIDVYHATVDNFTQSALQSLHYFNYLRDGLARIPPSKSELQLQHASRIGNSKRVVKLLDKVVVEAGVNTRVPYLDGNIVFGTTK